MLRRVSLWSLCVFVFTVPWERIVLLPGVGTFSRFVGFFAAVVGCGVLVVEGREHRFDDVHILLGCYTAWVTLSLLWTSNASATRVTAFTTVQLFVAIVLLWEFGREPRAGRALLYAFLFGCFVSGVFTFVNFNASGGEGTRFVADNFDANDLAFILVLGIPFSWYLVLTGRRNTVLAQAYLIVALPAIFLTGSRGALFALAVALCMLVMTFGRFSVRQRGVLVAQFVLLTVAVAAVAPPETLDRLGSTQSEITSGDLNSRAQLWDAAATLVNEHPWVGVGAGVARAQLVKPDGTLGVAHNTYLAIAADVGMIGLAMFLLAMLSIAVRAFRFAVVERAFVLIVLATLFVGFVPLSLQDRKMVWVAIGLLTIIRPPIRTIGGQESGELHLLVAHE